MGGWRSWLARLLDMQKAGGSNPLPPTILLRQATFVLGSEGIIKAPAKLHRRAGAQERSRITRHIYGTVRIKSRDHEDCNLKCDK